MCNPKAPRQTQYPPRQLYYSKSKVKEPSTVESLTAGEAITATVEGR